MAIILEGFDNSGKSTLAPKFGREIVHPGPKPRNMDETKKCLKDQRPLALKPVVMDRVTCISNYLYNEPKLSTMYWEYISDMVATPGCVVIYCRPPIHVIKDFSTHEIKSYDDEQRVEWLKAHADEIIARYDRFMDFIPSIVYDYTRDNEALLIKRVSEITDQFDNQEWRRWRVCLGR